MNEAELREALTEIERIANAALGEALVSSLLIVPLVETQLHSGALDGKVMLRLAENSLRILEENDHFGLGAGASVFAYAGARLQVLLSRETGAPQRTNTSRPTSRRRRS